MKMNKEYKINKDEKTVTIPLVVFEKEDVLKAMDNAGIDNAKDVQCEDILSQLDAMGMCFYNDCQGMQAKNDKYAIFVLGSDGSILCCDFSVLKKMINNKKR